LGFVGFGGYGGLDMQFLGGKWQKKIREKQIPFGNDNKKATTNAERHLPFGIGVGGNPHLVRARFLDRD
jgi:hypothetical protein